MPEPGPTTENKVYNVRTLSFIKTEGQTSQGSVSVSKGRGKAAGAPAGGKKERDISILGESWQTPEQTGTGQGNLR